MFSSPQSLVAAYKSAKLETNGKGASRAATVSEDEDGGDAGPALPAGFFDVAPEEEDEEGGRFFGGGVNKEQAEILDYVDEREREAGDAGTEKIDAAWLRKMALAFERKISKNAEMRGKFEDDPHKSVHPLLPRLLVLCADWVVMCTGLWPRKRIWMLISKRFLSSRNILRYSLNSVNSAVSPPLLAYLPMRILISLSMSSRSSLSSPMTKSKRNLSNGMPSSTAWSRRSFSKC